MYRYFLDAADGLLGGEYSRILLLVMGALAALTLVVLFAPPLRARLEALGTSGKALGQTVYFAFHTLQVLLALTGLFLICALLHVQAGLLSERQGQVTQRNYDAVRTKWGIPQELRILHASLCVTEKVTKETFAGGGERELVAPSEEMLQGDEDVKVLSDESFPVKRDKDNKVIDRLEVARREVSLRQRTLPGRAVVSSAAEFDIKYNPRYLGGAGYPGYEYKADLEFDVVNPTDAPALGVFSFGLPGAGYGVYDNLQIRVDGEPQKGVSFEEGSLQWRRVLPAQARLAVSVSYNSRGLQFLRYTPGNFLERCQAVMRVSGFDAARLDFPIGAMSPNTDLKTLKGEQFTLNWDLSNAVTNYSIGLIVPAPVQPGFAASVILKQAPLGIVVLLLALTISRMLLGRGFCRLSTAFSLILLYFGYALFAYLSDGMESFYTAYGWAILPPALFGAIFWALRDWRQYAGWQSAMLYLLLGAGYPLVVYQQDTAGAILNFGYVALTVYLMGLYLISRRAKHTGAGDSAANGACR